MGEVYRARDTTLKRDVAIKVLPASLAADPSGLVRFTREAQTLAALNDPHIAQIHGVLENPVALVMEFVDGEDLAQRLVRGPVSNEDALRIARQIADGLDAAHTRGIVHRDLKPANIKVRADGVVKILDFGIAKLVAADQVESDLTSTATRAGVIVGTIPYMSPEQACGKDVDKRTDIWSFGCVLFEMLSAKRAFAAGTPSQTIAAILEREPDWSVIDHGPPAMRVLIRRCLVRDAGHRLRDIGDARFLLDHTTGIDVPSVARIPRTARLWRRVLPWFAGAALGLAIGVIGGVFQRTPPSSSPPVRFAIDFAPGEESPTEWGRPVDFAISPDGQRIVYVARKDGVTRLYGRRLEELDAHAIEGTEGASGPFFSPSGGWVGFADGSAIRRVPVTGGRPVVVCASTQMTGASWGDNDQIVFGGWGQPLMTVPAAGGTPQPIPGAIHEQNPEVPRFPHLLPGGRAMLSASRGHVEFVQLSTGERRLLLEGNNPSFVRSGHLVFARGGTLLSVPFDPARGEVTGQEVVLQQGIEEQSASFKTHVAVSSSGSVLYLPRSSRTGTLSWINRAGERRDALTERLAYTHPRLSPDGNRVAVGVYRESGEEEVWVYDLKRKTGWRVGAHLSLRAVWAPDAKSLTFSRLDGALITVPAEGGPSTTELEQPGFLLFPLAWSPRSGMLLYSAVNAQTSRNVWSRSKDGETRPFLNTVADERAATFSPDGNWVIYAVLEAAAREQVYVQSLGDPGSRVPASKNGGAQPRWSPTGHEVFYRSLDGRQVVSVDVQTAPVVRVGEPRVLFEGRFVDQSSGFYTDYDVSQDGKEFLMITTDDETRTWRLNIILGAVR
jgi:serine/threonine-protein kinase